MILAPGTQTIWFKKRKLNLQSSGKWGKQPTIPESSIYWPFHPPRPPHHSVAAPVKRVPPRPSLIPTDESHESHGGDAEPSAGGGGSFWLASQIHVHGRYDISPVKNPCILHISKCLFISKVHWKVPRWKHLFVIHKSHTAMTTSHWRVMRYRVCDDGGEREAILKTTAGLLWCLPMTRIKDAAARLSRCVTIRSCVPVATPSSSFFVVFCLFNQFNWNVSNVSVKAYIYFLINTEHIVLFFKFFLFLLQLRHGCSRGRHVPGGWPVFEFTRYANVQAEWMSVALQGGRTRETDGYKRPRPLELNVTDRSIVMSK